MAVPYGSQKLRHGLTNNFKVELRGTVGCIFMAPMGLTRDLLMVLSKVLAALPKAAAQQYPLPR
jgi:hypothetical protein